MAARVYELEAGEMPGRVNEGSGLVGGVAGGAVLRVLGVGDAGGPRRTVQSCSLLTSGHNCVGVGETGSWPASQWYLLVTGRSPALFWSMAS